MRAHGIPVAAIAFAAIIAGCWPPPSSVAADRPSRIVIDWDETHQKIVGFGGTMGWIHPHPEDRRAVLDLLFRRLGASVLRVRALGGEGGDEDSLEPENDNDDPSAFDWSRFRVAETEAKNALLIKGAIERGVETVIPTAWSPPGWMKDSGRRAGGGELKADHRDEYAEAWAAYVIGMKRHFGIETKLLSIQNEPDLTYYYPTCRFDSIDYALSAEAVQKRLRKEKLGVTVLGPDTCRLYNMPRYLARMEKAELPAKAPVLTHLYDLSVPFGRPASDPRRWREAARHSERLGRGLWLMETANYLSGDSAQPASWDEAFVWAQKIHHALVWGGCEVVCYWALFFDKKGEALIYCPGSESRDYEITPKFYTSMNYYRFVRPGMLRCTALATGRRLLVSAFRDARSPGGRAAVVVNTSPLPVRAAFPARRGETWLTYTTTEALKCRQDILRSGAVVLPGRSVTTFVHEAGARPR